MFVPLRRRVSSHLLGGISGSMSQQLLLPKCGINYRIHKFCDGVWTFCCSRKLEESWAPEKIWCGIISLIPIEPHIRFQPSYWYDPNQGPLADMDLSLHDFSFCGWPQVVWELSVATIVNLAWIQRYHMKDMDILFQLVPYNPILSKWLGHSDLAKLGVFWCFSWFPHALEICIQILIFKFTPFKDGAT